MELTPTEERFLDVLVRYEKMLPDGSHIIPEGRQERMRRSLAFSSLEEVYVVMTKLTDVMVGLTDVVEGITQGGMRDLWVPNIRYILNDVGEVADLLHEIAEAKLN